MCCKPGQECEFVFHTASGRQLQKPLGFLNAALVDAGMQGNITFTQIRSSVSTQASKHLSEKERKQVAKEMCHDPSTAERFYVALPDKVNGYKTRRLRLKAMESALDEDDELETSSSGEEPQYDDQTESDSSLSEEGLTTWQQKKQSKSEQSSSSVAPHPSNGRLYFTSPTTGLEVQVMTKCCVSVNKLGEPIGNYLFEKMMSTYPILKKDEQAAIVDHPRAEPAPPSSLETMDETPASPILNAEMANPTTDKAGQP
ncbi:uncharacterized protein LOC117941332 [Etheostoma cragini]|uniref:uncharacterized protein LOC117941332 n=1 Tax=Etheostoma cragini TaxID=417921 RepID=UPI00155E3E7E|nr:uncharacterized protein LOC117941332 [Etheostoma cragini]